ncbi:MAG: rod shape-determining protein MreD [Phycisphaerae bacterium]|nr:rod shape-determining protein MreD [Phycisphaerae bacterium]
MSISYFKLIILTLIIVIIQVSVIRPLGLTKAYVFADLPMALLVALLFRVQEKEAVPTGWLIGLIKDLFTSTPFGLYTLGFCLIAILFINIRRVIYARAAVRLILGGLVAVLLVEYGILTFEIFRGHYSAAAFKNLATIILLSALITALIAPIFSLILGKFHKSLGLRSQIYK